MSPRKSETTKAGLADDTAGNGTPAKESAASKEKDGVNIDDLNLPKSIVTRLAKGVLPANTQIQGNAILAMQKSATVFVNYLATHANEYTQAANRKTMQPADVLKALTDLELDGFRERLEAELAKFSEVQAEKRSAYRKKVPADTSKSINADDARTRGEIGDEADGPPATKKARREAGDDKETLDEARENANVNESGDETIEGQEREDEDDEDEDAEDDDEDEDVEEDDIEANETLDGTGIDEHGEGENATEIDEALDDGTDSD